LLAFVLGTTGVQFKIPEVENVVGNILRSHDNYVHFHGNHSATSAVSKRQTSTYWYENIAHQGISAFGPSGYQVFRNVKAYGAKGRSHLYCPRVFCSCLLTQSR
jgi:glucan 1,3-beta-glucosidase